MEAPAAASGIIRDCRAEEVEAVLALWRQAEASFVASMKQYKQALQTAGFTIVAERNRSATGWTLPTASSR